MSIVVPPVDLAPSLPSRIVTVKLTDLPEGGLIDAPGWIEFVLPGDLRVPANDVIVRAGSVRLELDASGEGQVRLPVHNPAAQGDGVGGDWYLLVRKSWTEQVDMIRVPAGTGQISLAKIAPVVNVTPAMGQWLITNATVTAAEGANWAAGVTVDGGIAKFNFTFPPGGTAYSRGNVSTGSMNDLLDDGAYRVTSTSNTTDKPANVLGSILVFGGTYRAQMFVSWEPEPRVWVRRLQGGTWGAWNPIGWKQGNAPSGFDFDGAITHGYVPVVTTSTTNGPTGHGIGILEVFQFGSGAMQRYTEANTGRVAMRRSIAGVFGEWMSAPTDASVDAQIAAALAGFDASGASVGFRTVPLAVTLPGTTQTQAQAAGSVRWSRRWSHKPTRVRLHISNRNPGNNVHSGSANIVGAKLGVGSESGALTQAVDALGSGLMPGDGGELVGPWIAVPGTDGDWLTVSIGYTAGTDQQLLQGGGWTNPYASAYNDANTTGWTYSQETPFYAWLEAEVPSRVPILLVHGDSSVIGTASETPVQDSFAMQYALGEGALPVFYAQHGSTMANWQTDSARWSAFYPGLTVAADAVLTGIGGNDLGGGADLSVMQSRWAGIRAAHEQRWPGIPVYVCNRYASTRPPAVEVIRREFNSWLESRPVDERWVFDFSSVLSDAEDEALKPEYSADGLHPNRAGHLAVTALLTATPPTPFAATASRLRLLSEGALDTGWRNVSSLLAGVDPSSELLLRRVGPIVYLDFRNIVPTTLTSGGTIYQLPTRFRPKSDVNWAQQTTLSSSASRSAFITVGGPFGVWAPATSDSYSGIVSFPVDHPWPTTLPGVPV